MEYTKYWYQTLDVLFIVYHKLKQLSETEWKQETRHVQQEIHNTFERGNTLILPSTDYTEIGDDKPSHYRNVGSPSIFMQTHQYTRPFFIWVLRH